MPLAAAGCWVLALWPLVALAQNDADVIPDTDAIEATDDETRLLMESVQRDLAARTPQPQNRQPSAGSASAVVQSMNPDIAAILDVAGAYFSREPLQEGAHDPNF